MNDIERRDQLVAEIQGLSGVAEAHDQRIRRILDESREPFGYDSRGRLKLAFFDAHSYDREAFQAANAGHFDITFLESSLSLETVDSARGFRAVCLFVNDRCDEAILERLAALGVEFVALRCAGFNHVDLAACARYNIAVARVPAYSPYAVAEHCVGLMLTLNRKFHQAYQRNRAGYFVLDGLTGFDMHGKTVGIIGTGKIGRCAAAILRGFGCRILAFDKYPDDDLAATDGVSYTSLEELFQQSDIITLHTPLTDETHHMIDRAAIEIMKTGVMIINTSRGGLIDSLALVDGLKSTQIGSAGLDVYEEESGIFFHDYSNNNRIMTDDVLARLLTFNNVIVTSHQGFLTREALSEIAATTLANLTEFAGGKRGDELTHSIAPG